jgi:hypothetical protein
MGHELEGSEIAAFVAAELLLGDIANILHDLSEMLRGHICLLSLDKTSLPLLSESVSLMS